MPAEPHKPAHLTPRATLMYPSLAKALPQLFLIILRGNMRCGNRRKVVVRVGGAPVVALLRVRAEADGDGRVVDALALDLRVVAHRLWSPGA